MERYVYSQGIGFRFLRKELFKSTLILFTELRTDSPSRYVNVKLFQMVISYLQ